MENGISIQNLRIFAEMYNFAYNVKKLGFYYTVKGASHFVHEANYVTPSPPRGLGSGPSRSIKKESHLIGGFSFLEREKGLGPSTPTLARSCSTN